MILIVQCPACKKKMKCSPRTDITKAIKKCVYCNRNFKIHSSLEKSRVVGKVFVL